MRVVCFLKGDIFINNTFFRRVPIFGIFSTIFKYSQIFTNFKNWGTLPLKIYIALKKIYGDA